jgi:hypothetical protein
MTNTPIWKPLTPAEQAERDEATRKRKAAAKLAQPKKRRESAVKR